MSTIFFYFSVLCGITSASLIAPVLTAIVEGNRAIAVQLTIYMLLGLFFSSIVFVGFAGRARKMPQIGSFVLALVIWFGLPLLIALPLGAITGLSFVDALFDAIGALTTTGASALPSWENLPWSILLFYAQIQWVGGLITLLTLLFLIAPSSIGGLPTPRSIHFFGRSILSNDVAVLKLFFQVLKIYGGLTVCCFIFLLVNGTAPFYAFILALFALSTGHVELPEQLLDDALGNGGLFIMGVFLLIGGTSMFWHEMLVKWRVLGLKKHRESYFIFGFASGLGLLLAVLLYKAAGSSDILSPIEALAEGFFHASSIITTSGLESRTGVIGLLPATLILFIIFIGCGVFSSGGGIKFYRLGAMLVQAGNELRRLLYPNVVEARRFGSKHYDVDMMKAVLSFFIATILVIGTGALCISASEVSGEASLFAAISSFANAGAFYGPVLVDGQSNEWPHYYELAWHSKMVLGLLMVLGRLEILVVFGALNLTYWRNR